MTWPPPIADDLPAPRDDEPPELRHDIADELADHLACSLNRELHRTADETAAKRSVIDRFGDPVQIARKLWFDALKEKIMSQRIVVTAAVFLALAGFASTGMTWLIIRQTRELNEQLLADSRAVNQALLEKLAEFANRKPAEAPPPRSMEWNPVKVRLIHDDATGKPAGGMEARLKGFLLDTAKEIEVVRTSGPDGMLDFGLVRPGQHSFYVKTPWDEFMNSIKLTVLPGQEFSEKFVCPGGPPEVVDVEMAVEWPDALRDAGLWPLFDIRGSSRDISGHTWALLSGDGSALMVIDHENKALQWNFSDLMVSTTRRRQDVFDAVVFPGRFIASQSGFGVGVMSNGGPGRPAGTPPNNMVLALPKIDPVPRTRRKVGTYSMLHLVLVHDPQSDKASESNDARLLPIVSGVNFQKTPSGATFIEDSLPFGRGTETSFELATPKFEAKQGVANKWIVTIPQPMVDRAIAKLAKAE